MFPSYAFVPILWASWAVELIDGAGCDDLLPQADRDSLQSTISSNKVVVYGISNARCTVAAEDTFKNKKACMKTSYFDASSPMWSYLQCLYPDEKVGDMPMHSYVWIGGDFVGNGFKLLLDSTDYRCSGSGGKPCLTSAEVDSKLSAAGADLSCAKDCSGFISDAQIAEINAAVSQVPVVLYGWNGCPCVNMARARFQQKGVCYVENVWADGQDPLQQYLQCVHGQEHHSFVFIGGKFIGNGFHLDPRYLSDQDYQKLLDDANGVSYMCQQESDKSLLGGPLQSCTQDNDGTTTGWTRTGSCVWDPSDAGYHQVCVTMSTTFLQSSAEYDSNDLSSVVQEGGHWCICAWAWASAVSRDPVNYEGIILDCERTNTRLRNVYELYISQSKKMTSPSGAQYAVEQALEQVNKVCDPSKTTNAPSTDAPTTTASTTTTKREETTVTSEPAAADIASVTEEPSTEKVTLSMTMKNVKFDKLDTPAKEALATACEEVIAEKAGVPKSAVTVTLAAGSVIIKAEIQLPEGQAADVQSAVQQGDLSSQVVSVAKDIPGVQDAATGEIEVTPVEIDAKGMDFTASDQTQDSSKAPAPPPPSPPAPEPEVAATTTKTSSEPSTDDTQESNVNQASGAGYPKVVMACVLPALAVMLICSHKPAVSAAPLMPMQHRDPLVEGTELAEVS
jgi:uncharacterized protein (DUF2237 family)/glutaredoxin